ncbi:MAG: PEP-utilizing enzyme [Candidatus Kerfeldbacteria bacterium]
MVLKKYFDRKEMYLYPWYLSDLVITKQIGAVTGRRIIRRVVTVIHRAFLTAYYDNRDVTSIGEYLFGRVLHDRRFYQHVLKEVYARSDRLQDFCSSIPSPSKLHTLTSQKLLDLYDHYTTLLTKLRAWGWVPVFLDGIDTSYLSEEIQRRIEAHLRGIRTKPDTALKIYATLTSSERMSEVQREEIARLKLTQSIHDDPHSKTILRALTRGTFDVLRKRFPAVMKVCERHVARFGWLTYAYSGPPMGLSYLATMLCATMKQRPAQRLQEIQRHFLTIRAAKRALIRKYHLSPDIQYLVRVSAELMYMKDFRKGVYQKSYVAMDPVLIEIAKRLNLTLTEVKYLTFDEIRKALRGAFRGYAQAARKRTEWCAYDIRHGKVRVQGGHTAQWIARTLSSGAAATQPADSNLHGQVAYPGIVRGIARIVLLEKDVPKVKPGDILVSSSTNPNLILAMQRAGAFVTDIGGITSHAAIVSRELKKPCIVGTKIATKSIRDGDRLEVDANHGIVRKL